MSSSEWVVNNGVTEKAHERAAPKRADKRLPSFARSVFSFFFSAVLVLASNATAGVSAGVSDVDASGTTVSVSLTEGTQARKSASSYKSEARWAYRARRPPRRRRAPPQPGQQPPRRQRQWRGPRRRAPRQRRPPWLMAGVRASGLGRTATRDWENLRALAFFSLASPARRCLSLGDQWSADARARCTDARRVLTSQRSRGPWPWPPWSWG